jgi:hypothetical protein
MSPSDPRSRRLNGPAVIANLAETSMHHFVPASDIRPAPAFPDEAKGYRRFSLSDRDCGAVHSGWGLSELDAKGST